MGCKNTRHGIKAAGREVCNATRCRGDGSHLFLSQRVRGLVRAVKVVRNTRLFLTETRFVADAINSDQIANWRMGGESASKTASFRYISYSDTITTQILNWSQSSEFAKMRLCSKLNLAKKQRVYVRSGLQTGQDRAVQVSGQVRNRTKQFFWSNLGPLPGYPHPLITLHSPTNQIYLER